MLASILSLQGRMGRLPFFLGSLCLTIVSPAFLLAVMVVGPGLADPRPHAQAPYVLIGGVALVLAAAAIWIGVLLHARRIRDIGWSPGLIVAGWLVFRIVDAIVAFKLAHRPAGLVVVDYGFWLLLIFMPGHRDDIDKAAPRPPLPPRRDANGNGAPRLVQAGFGRRGLGSTRT